MVHYPEAIPEHMSQPQQPIPAVQHQPPTPEPYRETTPEPELVSAPEPWYQYQPPVEVATIGQLPPYGSGIYDLYGGAKLDFEDPSMPPLPSSRIESM